MQHEKLSPLYPHFLSLDVAIYICIYDETLFMTPPYHPRSSASFSSYLRRRSLSTQPPGGNFFSHRLCRCTANTLPSLRSRPPPSARVKPAVHRPSLGSGMNRSGRRLSRPQEKPSVKGKGRSLNGGM